jgi:WD repeat-containing protein 76
MEEEARRVREQEEQIEREEQARAAKRPRHEDLDLSIMGDEMLAQELMSLTARLEQGDEAQKHYDLANSKKEESQVAELKTHFENLKIVGLAKVTDERVYSSLYHPEKVRFSSPL